MPPCGAPSATLTAGSLCLFHRRWPRRLSTAFASSPSMPVAPYRTSLAASLSRSMATRHFPRSDEIVRRLADPDGVYGMPTDAIPSMLVTGGADAVAARVDGWANLGAERVVFTIAAGDWHRQVELLASAVQDSAPGGLQR